MLSYFANPARFMTLSAWASPIFLGIAFVLFAVGTPWALWLSPADYQQGETVRIMYIHVPAAWMAMLCYLCVAAGSTVGLIWRALLVCLFLLVLVGLAGWVGG